MMTKQQSGVQWRGEREAGRGLSLCSKRGIMAAVGLLLTLTVVGCATSRKQLDEFESRQTKRTVERTHYNQALLNFSASALPVSVEDLNQLSMAWTEYAHGAPQSKHLSVVDTEVRNLNQRILLLAVYTPDVDKSDLLNKTQGWVLSPSPHQIQELSQEDDVLRTLFPRKNMWARIFLLKFSNRDGVFSQGLQIANPLGKVQLEWSE